MADRTYEGPYQATELFLPDGRSTIVTKGEVAKDLPDDFAAALDDTGDWQNPKSKPSSKTKES